MFVCIFRIAERQRLSANDKQYNLFAVFVCFTALQKGKDFLPMTNSAIYLRCLSVSSALQKGKDFLLMTNSAVYLRCLSVSSALQKGRDFLPMTNSAVNLRCLSVSSALQKGKDFLPMTNSAIYLRCLSVSSASQKGKDFLPMTNSAIYLRCLSMGTTQVPVALQTTMGSSRKSHAESLISVRGTITLRASKLILRELLPIWVISPYASI